LQNTTQYLEEEKIDLKKIFNILKNRKRLLFLIPIFVTLTALIYVFFIAKPVYSVRTMIEVGQIEGKPVDNINNIQQKLSYEYHVNSKGVSKKLPYVKNVSVPKKSNSIISLTIYGNNNEEAKKYIETVIHKIEIDYREKTNASINNTNELINHIQRDINDHSKNLTKMEKELETFNQKIISLKSEDAALAGIYVMQIGQSQTEINNLKKYISTLKNKLQALKFSLTPVMIRPTRIVGDIETIEKPIKPKKKLIVIATFIVSLMFSVFLAFFLDFIERTRKEP